ncbi:MAG: hypothetical protein KAI24_05715 [Planctomycetes bacterium]|nr:hypothetical protein [Planctomycetota bacterium]
MTWIQSVYGAFSIVLADTAPGSGEPDPETLMIRARRRAHLDALKARFSPLSDIEVIESSPRHDYRWRMIAPKTVVAQVVSDLVLDISWRNFKGACSNREAALGPGYTAALHTIWSTLARLQE